MKTWNRFVLMSISALAMLFFVTLCATNASAQYAVLMPKQTFSTNALPNGWSANWGNEDVNGTPYWFWNPVNPSGTGGSAMDDIWDYNDQPLTTPTVDASSFTAPGDSVWVDFDFFWEYNEYDYEYQYDFGYTLDEFEIDANSDVLVQGTTDQLYTYYSLEDYNFDVAQSSSSYWRHYHILIPIADRTPEMQINFLGNYDEYPGPGLSDVAITNVTITAYPPPPVPELSLTPKTLSFGTTTPNAPDTLYATVQNVGALPLSISDAFISGTGLTAYSIVSGPEEGTQIQPDSSVQYGIQFEPLSNGLITDSLTVVTNGQDSGTQIVSLTGIGAVPEVSYSANTMFQGVDVELTHTSAVQYLYLNSIGLGPLSVNGVSFIGLNASDYDVVYQPAGPIPPGGVDSIGVQFSPTIEGLPDAHMVINSSGVNNPSDTVLMYGVGILPHLAIDSGKSWPLPAKVNFDSVQLGSSSCQTVLLTNPGSDTVAIEQNYFESADPDFSLTPLTGSDTLIPPGGSQTITVCFTPVQQGTRIATLTIRTNIPNTLTKPAQDTSQFTVNFIGIGVPTGKLLITGPANGNTFVDKSVCVTDTFWNTGAATLTVDSVTITGANAADFTATYPTLPFTMAANSSQIFSVCADPADTGSETAILTGYGTSNESPAIATLSLSVYGQSINDTAVVTVPFAGSCGFDTETVTVTNTGNVIATYDANISGGTNPSDFVLLSPTSSPEESSGGTASFKIVFLPSTTSPETTDLVITGGTTITVPLSATSGAAIINGSGTAAAATPSGPAENFTDTLTNTGTCPWTPGVPTLPEESPFAYLSGGTTAIPAGGTGMLTFTFTPPASPGTYTASVSFLGSTGLSIPAANDNVFGAVSSADVAPAAVSDGFSLEQNYPNPFNQTSSIEITLPVPSLVHLTIVDVEGQVVETLLNQHYDAGSFEVSLDATGLASGTYYYQMTAGDVTLTRQMVILK